MLGKLLRQFAGVAVLHGLIVLLPIVVVPHLVRQLGPDGFGRLSLALAISGILMPVLDMASSCDYGSALTWIQTQTSPAT